LQKKKNQIHYKKKVEESEKQHHTCEPIKITRNRNKWRLHGIAYQLPAREKHQPDMP
jgi:hypothetical protein